MLQAIVLFKFKLGFERFFTVSVDKVLIGPLGPRQVQKATLFPDALFFIDGVVTKLGMEIVTQGSFRTSIFSFSCKLVAVFRVVETATFAFFSKPTFIFLEEGAGCLFFSLSFASASFLALWAAFFSSFFFFR